MRLQSALLLGLSFFTALASGERLKCGAPGSPCTGNDCNQKRSVDRRAFRSATGDPAALFGKAGNVNLSNQSKRDAWIPFDTSARSTTITGLTGCTAVIAISQQGMYAFHIWETGTGDTLDPSKYKATLTNVQNKLASKKTELAGGQLFLLLPNNPDQPSQLLYESERWNNDETQSESEPGKNPGFTKIVPRSQAIRDAITAGSGLAITAEKTYLPPKEGETKSSSMTAQFDPAFAAKTKAYGVWADMVEMAPTHTWAA